MTPRSGQQLLQAMQRQVRHLLDLRQYEHAMRCQAARLVAVAGAAIPASRTRFDHFTTVEGAIE